MMHHSKRPAEYTIHGVNVFSSEKIFLGSIYETNPSHEYTAIPAGWSLADAQDKGFFFDSEQKCARFLIAHTPK
jgi:hypothetical protein